MAFKSQVSVWAFAASVTFVAMIAALGLNILLYPKEILAINLRGTAVIVLLVSFPVSFYVGRKILENHMLSAELQRLVNRDRLTDVATRDFFFERMEHDPSAYGVSLMIDIDHFKKVNDTHGHLIGDEVIKKVGSILRKNTRTMDIVCRFGGEEFIIFLHEATRENGFSFAERIRKNVEAAHLQADGKDISVTVSIGGSMKESYEDIMVSVREADEALYKAKQAGRNQTVVSWLPFPVIKPVV